MTQDEIIEMAKVVGFSDSEIDTCQLMFQHFANLVAQHEREKTVWTQKHWTEYEHKIVAAEREACAKVCEAWQKWGADGELLSKAIRARGQA